MSNLIASDDCMSALLALVDGFTGPLVGGDPYCRAATFRSSGSGRAEVAIQDACGKPYYEVQDGYARCTRGHRTLLNAGAWATVGVEQFA